MGDGAGVAKRRTAIILSAAITPFIAVVSLPFASDQAARSASNRCTFPPSRESPVVAPAEPSTPTDRAWFDGLQRVFKVLDRRFGQETMDIPILPLSRGLIGEIRNYPHSVTIAVDPHLLDRVLLSEDLRAAGAPDLDVHLAGACHSSSELLQARQVILDADWHPDAAATAHLGGLDERTATWEVGVIRGRRDVGEALQRRLGELVTVEYAAPATAVTGCHAASSPPDC